LLEKVINPDLKEVLDVYLDHPANREIKNFWIGDELKNLVKD
jgi:hypothetical protein